MGIYSLCSILIGRQVQCLPVRRGNVTDITGGRAEGKIGYQAAGLLLYFTVMLYVYSDEVPELDARLRETLGPKHTLTVIPATPRDLGAARHHTAHFRGAGLHARLQSTRFYRDPVCLRNIILNSDAVFLMGGNTFEFLAYAGRMGLFAILREFESRDGVIASESAGSIILSPNIATALLPTTCPDEQTVELDDYRGMSRIPFHVSPHFDPAAAVAGRELHELQALADFSSIPVLVLRDGEGIIMEGNSIIHTVGCPTKLEATAPRMTSAGVPAYIPAWAVPATRC